MSHFLYISDVFCPWCYGFAPVMQRISSEHPGYPVRVLSGDLVENPTTTGEMMRNHPTMREFFVRLAKTTGQAVGQDFLRRLEQGQGDLRMFSPDMAVPLAALKKLAPGHELEQMEAFQSAFYGEGRDVLAPEVQMRIANVDGYRPPRKPDERKRSIYWVTLWFIPRSFLKRTTASAMCWRAVTPIIPLWPPSLPPCSAEEPAARRHAPPTRAASTGIAIFQHEGERSGRELFQKSSLPEPLPQKLRFVGRPRNRSPFRSREKLPILCASLFPLFLQIKNPPSMSERVLFLSTRKSDKEGFDNIESLGRKEPGEGRCYRCP